MSRCATPAWQALTRHAASQKARHLRQLFAEDPRRFDDFSLAVDDCLLDYSKQRVTRETMTLLQDLAGACDFSVWQQRLVDGEPVNQTEGRAALHMALRARSGSIFPLKGGNQVPAVQAVLARMQRFCEAVHGGSWRGFSGESITDVVNIGIGGSDLGPRMAAHALSAWSQPDLRVHFVANVDGADLAATLCGLNPRRTLFVLSSKTFTTAETLTNGESALQWLRAAAGDAAVQDVARHFVAVTANPEAAAAWGIERDHIFEFWDWVGGRFSLWSAIGLPLALAIGFHHFEALLAGAQAMDQHFCQVPPERNLPLILALLSLWNTCFLGAASHAILPYSQSLASFPAYLQQLEMESLGKQAGRDGLAVEIGTAPVIWGACGTNGQHSFYQLLHQGGQLIPCDFIAFKQADYPLPGHHAQLLAHCLAQSAALAFGRTVEEAQAAGVPQALLPFKVFPGNQPSTTLLLTRLDPRSLGQLIALYEHKVFCLGVLWGINPFDQWGVELGKQLAGRLLPFLNGEDAPVAADAFDASTRGLLSALGG